MATLEFCLSVREPKSLLNVLTRVAALGAAPEYVLAERNRVRLRLAAPPHNAHRFEAALREIVDVLDVQRLARG